MQGPVSGRRIKRRTVRTIILVVTVLALALAAIAGGVYFSEKYARQAQQEEEARNVSQVSNLAAKISEPITQIDTTLESLIKSQALADLFSAADTAAINAKADELQGMINTALKVRLFLPGQYQLDRESRPPLGYASLDLLNHAMQSDAEVPAEVHSFGSEDAHLVMIRRIKDAEGNLKGLLHLSLAVEPYISLDGAAVEGYVQLVQSTGNRPLVLNKAGNNKLQQGNPVSEEIPGTRWKISYWPAGTAVPAVEKSSSGMLMYLIIALLLVAGGGGGYVFVRSRRQSSDADEPAADSNGDGENIVYAGAVRAIMDGQHPGLEKLVPGMPNMGQTGSVQPLSRGMSGDDVTAFARPGNQPPVKEPAPAQKMPPQAAAKKPAAPAPTAAATTAPPEALSPVIFRAYDIRGVVGKTLTAAIVQEIGRAIGSEAKARNQPGIVVGRDGRTSSPEMAEALINGLRSTGCDVIDIGQVATPVLYFATYHLETGSGVMVTGSHNGPEYNGLKIMLNGETLSDDAIQALRKRVESSDYTSGQGSLQTVDITADYLRRASEDIPVALGGAFKMVVDAGNGVAGGIAPQLYRALGHDVIELYCEIDGNFPNHHPDPSQPGNLTALINKVKETGADIGFAFDGDGDRLGVVDNEGNIIWPDRQMMLFARDVLSRNAGETIIYDVKCSRYLKAIVEASGGKPLMWKTGHSLIKSKMKELNAPLAGEMSGHIFFKERWYGFDDGIYAGARMLEILTKAKAKPAEVFGDLPGGVATPELRIPMQEKYHTQFMQMLRKKMSFADAEVTDIDGVRVDFANGWGLIRPSNTSPNLIARFEAEDNAALEHIEAQFRDLIRAVAPDLKLPF